MLQFDNRHRNHDGEISHKHGNTLIGTLRKIYGQGFAAGYPATEREEIGQRVANFKAHRHCNRQAVGPMPGSQARSNKFQRPRRLSLLYRLVDNQEDRLAALAANTPRWATTSLSRNRAATLTRWH